MKRLWWHGRPMPFGAWIWGVWAMLLGWGLWLGAHAAPLKLPSQRGLGRGSVARQGMGPRERGEWTTTVGAATGPTLPGSAVYPAQSLPLRFSHQAHVSRGMACERCHTAAATSTRAADLLIPAGASCDGCHGAQHPRPTDGPKQCSKCHTGTDEAGRVTQGLRMPRPLLRFDHKLHHERKIECKECHGDMAQVRLATRLQLPTEASCLSCHDGFTATGRCDACHPAGGDGRLLTRAQDDRVLPALVPKGRSAWGIAHDLTFVEDHAPQAKANPNLCASCHNDSFCTDCHAGAIRPMRIHAGDYLTLHAMDARGANSDCQSCHRTQSFCLGCHERLGFRDRSADTFGVGGGLQFHPANWSGPPGAPQGHAHQAQRNIAACTSCHDEDSCLACHATTAGPRPGFNVSPHGANFARSIRCDALSQANRRMCLRCHAPGDPQLQCL